MDQLWRHAWSGDVYAVRLDPIDEVVAANGPLYYGDYHTARLSPDFLSDLINNATDPGLAVDLSFERDKYDRVIVELRRQ